MTKQIFRSICAVAILVLMASLVPVMGVLYNYFSTQQIEQMKVQLALASQGVEGEGAVYFDGLDTGDYRFTWIDVDGTVLYDSQSDSSVMENHLDRDEVVQALEKGYGESRRYSRTLTEQMFYCAQALSDGTVMRLAGAQYTIFMLFMGIIQPLTAVVLVALIISMVLARHLSKQIVKPLNEINLDQPLENQVYEEIQPFVNRIDNQQSQLKQDKAELEKAEKIRQEFTANVSHELKTPLHSIRGYAELLKSGMVREADIQPFAEKIYSESRRMSSLVNDIIDLSHLDSGAKDMQMEETDLYLTAQNAVDSLQSIAEVADVELCLTGESVRLQGIPQLLYGIIYNLCDNGIKYNHKGGSVSVDVAGTDTSAVLTVTDNGIGIPQQDKERIFERFYRVDKSRSKAVGGTGLGLSIVKHAALIHNATIDVDSTETGTKFVVTFPKNRENAQSV